MDTDEGPGDVISAAELAQAQTNALVLVLDRVDELTGHLAYTIKNSVYTLPNSNVSLASPGSPASPGSVSRCICICISLSISISISLCISL
jgi:hypothetical protein